MFDSYVINVATQIIIQAIAAYGLNIIVGNAGQILLGHAAFVAIGAYSNAMLTTVAGLTALATANFCSLSWES